MNDHLNTRIEILRLHAPGSLEHARAHADLFLVDHLLNPDVPMSRTEAEILRLMKKNAGIRY